MLLDYGITCYNRQNWIKIVFITLNNLEFASLINSLDRSFMAIGCGENVKFSMDRFLSDKMSNCFWISRFDLSFLLAGEW